MFNSYNHTFNEFDAYESFALAFRIPYFELWILRFVMKVSTLLLLLLLFVWRSYELPATLKSAEQNILRG